MSNPAYASARYMMEAIDAGDVAGVEKQLDYGFPIDDPLQKLDARETPLIRAASRPFPATVKLLLARHADVNAQDAWGNTALIKACTAWPAATSLVSKVGAQKKQDARQLEIVEMLLDAGALIKLENNDDFHAIDIAAQADEVEVLESLLDRTSLRDGTSKVDMFSADFTSAVTQALEQHSENNTVPPAGGVVHSLARAYRDWLIGTPQGKQALEHYPELHEKMAKTLNNKEGEDYRALTEIIEKTFYVLHALHLPPIPDRVLPLITPKDRESFSELAGRIGCYHYRWCESVKDMAHYFSHKLLIPAAVTMSGLTPLQFVRAHICTAMERHYDNPVPPYLQTYVPQPLHRPVLSSTQSGEGQWRQTRLEHSARHAMLGHFGEIAARALLKGRNIEGILGLAAKWHSPQHVVPIELTPLVKMGRWCKLVPDFTVSSGHKVVCRTSVEETQEESRLMHNCVGTASGIVSKCLTGKDHVFSVVDKNGRSISTLLVGVPPAQEKPDPARRLAADAPFYLLQHRGKHNAEEPPPEAVKAIREWRQAITNGILAVDAVNVGETRASRLEKARSGHTWIEDLAGFEITREHSEKLFVHHRGTQGKEAGAGWEKGLRGLKFNPETGAFKDDKYNPFVRDVVANDGKKLPGETLTLAHWLSATGAKKEIKNWLHHHIDKTLLQDPSPLFSEKKAR